jgi:hypothetical protein
VSEVVNDRHGHLMNFYAVLKDPASFEQLQHFLDLTLHSEAEWEAARDLLRADEPNPVRRAAALFTCCRQSLSGRMSVHAPVVRTRLRGGRNDAVNGWEVLAWAEGRYRVLREYVDDGLSGSKDQEKRVAFRQLVLDSGKGDFEAVLVWSSSRFGRLDSLEGAEPSRVCRSRTSTYSSSGRVASV